MICDVIYSMLVLIWKIRVFQQTFVRVYFILNWLLNYILEIRVTLEQPFHWSSRSSRLELFCRKGVLTRVSFSIKLQALVCNFIKKDTLSQVFSCEFCDIFKKTFFHWKPPVAASRVPISNLRIKCVETIMESYSFPTQQNTLE